MTSIRHPRRVRTVAAFGVRSAWHEMMTAVRARVGNVSEVTFTLTRLRAARVTMSLGAKAAVHINTSPVGARFALVRVVSAQVLFYATRASKRLKVKGRHLYTATYMNMTSSGLQCEVAY